MDSRAWKLMWAMEYFRELPAPLSELDPAFLDIFFNFANTYTEESVLYAEVNQRKAKESTPSADMFRKLGYSEERIAGMELD
ncbi:hypothetical protein AGMMS50268_25080 [Spirochaetia bacterium]|nr:hypothetical protein AGMMS50268_25080 [Spirochaetia bacterium]